MRRFGDVLRLLSSLVLGMMVRDYDKITKSFECFYQRQVPGGHSLLATVTTFLLFAVFFRNIHGSSVYDEWSERQPKRPPPRFECYRPGKVLTFLFLLATLFIAPAAAAHYFGEHDTLNGVSSLKVFILLFASFGLYLFWNICLWLPECRYQAGDGVPEIGDIALNWLQIDMISMSLLAFLGINWLYLYDRNLPLPTTRIGWCFCAIAAGTILTDYWKNKNFYFPVNAELGE